MDRRKKKEYRRIGKSKRYIQLRNEFDIKYNKATTKYLEKHVTHLKHDNPGKAFQTLKKMGAQPGDIDDIGSFTLKSHMQQNLNITLQLERISEFFVFFQPGE